MTDPVRRRKTARSHDTLTLDPRNANRGTDRGRASLLQSLSDYGAGRSILTDRLGRIIAGNKTFEQARALGVPVQIVPTDGKVLVVVRRDDLDLDDPAARALAIADNRVAELDLDWDPVMLASLKQEGVALEAFWTPEEWAALTAEAGDADPAENAVRAPGPTTIVRGDLFQLGRHRLLCGDATDAADVARLLDGTTPVLMTADSPYGVNDDPAWRHRAFPNQRHAVGRVAHDDQAAWPAAIALFPGDVVYAWHAALATATVAATLEQSGFDLRAQIIWVKQHFALSRGHFDWGHEPCWYAVRRGRSARWHGGHAQSTVWSVPNLNAMGGAPSVDNVRTAHSTQKPVALFETPIRNHTVPGDAVYDPFLGSGTTLIAAEKLGRTALVMDVDEQYVQMALDRWQVYTGQTATPVRNPRRGRKS
jgi:DNA modification methylase